ncbi:CUB and peptidase domain-containing protein 1 [Acropora cervicornis]|uniref:CUB and peptidase domain-containing protein 1 n=1 Tax=Acropora cervicornis TaxID=6130 RepID=A0AAD9QYH0_ACRCE|nr:CUB and peptidase domain-containing protein 1 [Acropora cervicornis]
MNFLLALSVLCGFAAKLTTVSGLNSTATTVPPSTQPPAPTTHPGCSPIVNNTWESPGYPNSYPRNLDCNISLPIPSGAEMRIFFQAFYLPYDSFEYCWYDYLIIRNENGDDFGTYCGSRAWTTVVVNGTSVVLTFHSDSRNNSGRFRLLLTPIYPTAAPSTQPPAPTTYPACPQVINNTMESPGYPSYYSHRMDCNISVPIPFGTNMRIFFEHFYTPRYDWNCRYYGSLEIMNENGDSFGRYCGNRNGQAVVVNGSLVVLRFRSGYYGSYGRFRLLFTPANPTVAPSTQPPAPTMYPVCPQVVNNTMESPGYPSYYSHTMDCNISVPIPLGTNMRVMFQVFYISRFFWSCWYYGYLEIMNENGDSFGKYCGNKTGQAVLVNGNLVVLRFRSGYHGSYGRFRLLFTPVYPFPTSHPNYSQIPPSHGRDPQSQLRKFIANLRDILVQMENVVDNQLGGSSSGNFTKRDHIGRNTDAVKDVETAMKRAGQQKRNLGTVTFEQSKKTAAEVIAKMKDKEDQFKKRAQLDVAKGKSQVEDQMLAKEREESIQKNLFKEEKIGR